MAKIDVSAGPHGADSRTCRLSGDPVAGRARHKIAVKVTRNRSAANVATFHDDQPTPIAALH